MIRNLWQFFTLLCSIALLLVVLAGGGVTYLLWHFGLGTARLQSIG